MPVSSGSQYQLTEQENDQYYHPGAQPSSLAHRPASVRSMPTGLHVAAMILSSSPATAIGSTALPQTIETGRTVEVVPADLGADEGIARVAEILRTDASITMLVNNAGVGATAPLLQSDPDKMDAMIALNVVALTRLTEAVALKQRGTGTIINIASIVAIAPERLNGV